MGRQSFRYLAAFLLGSIISGSLLGLSIYGIITICFIKPSPSQSTFRLPPGQTLCIVAQDDWSDNWTPADDDDDSTEHITRDVRAERLAREEFTRKGKIRLTNNEQEANFIFLITIDPNATKQAVLAEVVTPNCYKATGASLARCDSRWMAWGESPAQLVRLFYKEVLP